MFVTVKLKKDFTQAIYLIQGHDETVSCVSNAGLVSVQHGWNPHYYNERLFNVSVIYVIGIKKSLKTLLHSKLAEIYF